MVRRLFVAFQYLLPRYLLTALVYRVARIRQRHVKNLLIRVFVRTFRINTDELARDTPAQFQSLNDFFTREMKHDARPVETDAGNVCSPVDGSVSAAGYLQANTIFQAKGLNYTLDELFATDVCDAHAFSRGAFATLYLAPDNYHRVHAPVAGTLMTLRYVPGDLFSVNQTTVGQIPGVFRRNERLVLQLATADGPAAVIFVGALNVGSISTPWTGEIRPRRKGAVEEYRSGDQPVTIGQGDLLGWFNLGSTVILLFPAGAVRWSEELEPGAPVVMGRRIGQRTRR